MRSHPCAWRVECRYPTGLGHEHTIRYTVCLWTTFALTEKGDHLFICASSSHWFQALTCSNVTLFRSSKHSVVCTTDLSAGWVSPDAWQPGQASVEMQKHSLEIFTDWVWVSVESTFFAKTAQTTDTKRPHGHSTWFLESKHWRLSLLLALLVLRNAMGTRPARWGKVEIRMTDDDMMICESPAGQNDGLAVNGSFYGQSSMFRF